MSGHEKRRKGIDSLLEIDDEDWKYCTKAYRRAQLEIIEDGSSRSIKRQPLHITIYRRDQTIPKDFLVLMIIM